MRRFQPRVAKKEKILVIVVAHNNSTLVGHLRFCESIMIFRVERILR
jgi:hypothetical protein